MHPRSPLLSGRQRFVLGQFLRQSIGLGYVPEGLVTFGITAMYQTVLTHDFRSQGPEQAAPFSDVVTDHVQVLFVADAVIVGTVGF